MDARMLAPHGCVRLTLLALSLALTGCHHYGFPSPDSQYSWWRFHRPMAAEGPTCPPMNGSAGNGAAYQPVGEYPIRDSESAEKPFAPAPAPPADPDAAPSQNPSLPPLSSDKAGRLHISSEGETSNGPLLKHNVHQTQNTSRSNPPRTLIPATHRTETVNEPVESQKKLVPPTQRVQPRELWNQIGKGYWYLIDVSRGYRPVKSPIEQKSTPDQKTSANTSGGDSDSLANELSKRIHRSSVSNGSTASTNDNATASARRNSMSVARNGRPPVQQAGKRVSPSRYAQVAQQTMQNKSTSAKRLTPIPEPGDLAARSAKHAIPDEAVAQSSASDEANDTTHKRPVLNATQTSRTPLRKPAAAKAPSDADLPLATAVFDFTQGNQTQTNIPTGPVAVPNQRRVTDAEIEPWPYTAQSQEFPISPYMAQSNRYSVAPQQPTNTVRSPLVGHTMPVSPAAR